MTYSTQTLIMRSHVEQQDDSTINRAINVTREMLVEVAEQSDAWNFSVRFISIARRELQMREAFRAWETAQEPYRTIAHAHGWDNVGEAYDIDDVRIINCADTWYCEDGGKYYGRTYRNYEACVIGEGFILHAAAEAV